MQSEPSTRELEEAIGHTFTNPALLREALTHPSYRHEQVGQPNLKDNQTLEYLGDAVLDYAVAHHQMAWDERDAGALTQIRSYLTNNKTLAEVAREIRLGDYLKFGAGEGAGGGADRTGNLADAVEALLGAVCLDSGINVACRVANRLLASRLAESRAGKACYSNPKGTLQERAQQAGYALPAYDFDPPMGPDHARRFRAHVSIAGIRLGSGEGTRRRDAEQQSALAALEEIGLRPIEEVLIERGDLSVENPE